MDKILREKVEKLKERELKLKNSNQANLSKGSELFSTSTVQNKGGRAAAAKAAAALRMKHPSMRQFQISFRLHSYGNDGRTLLKIPKGVPLPECLRQQKLRRIKGKGSRLTRTCAVCNKGDSRKYVCARTKKVTCSFACYKALK